MSTRPHEQELAEIEALGRELDRHVKQGLAELQEIREAQDRLLRPAPLIAFVHIPKTAGGTVTSMFAAAYTRAGVHDAGNALRSQEKSVRKVSRRPGGWELWCRRGGRVTAGHVPYGLFREHLPAGTRYMTFLREPVDRVLSHFSRHTFAKDPRVEKAIRRPGKGLVPSSSEERWQVAADLLDEALVEGPEFNNLATRLLCGEPEPWGDLSRHAVHAAKANLRRFAFVGIQERFDESMARLQAMLALDVPREGYLDRHVSSGRLTVEEISDEQRALIAERNQLDAELYRFGSELFEEAVASGASPAGRSASEPPVAFVHIPKTAGATVTSMLAAAYSRGEIHKAGNYTKGPEKSARKVANWHRKGGRISVGHVPYVLFREQLPPGTRYMTFLREPVDRVLSHYHRHIRRDPSRAGRALKRPGRTRADSLEQALVELRVPELTDFATRLLCEDPKASRLSATALDEAKANLGSFAFVGIQARFEESIVLLQRMLGLGSVPYMDRHVSSDRPAVAEISGEQRALIAEHNRLDAELFRFGLGLFEEAVAAADERFAADVEALRTRDAAVREEEWRAASIVHAVPALLGQEDTETHSGHGHEPPEVDRQAE
jgi:hypothetical protein